MVVEDIQVQGLYSMAKQTEIESSCGTSTNGGQFSRVHGRTCVSSFMSSSLVTTFMDGGLGHGTGRRRGSSARAEWWGRNWVILRAVGTRDKTGGALSACALRPSVLPSLVVLPTKIEMHLYRSVVAQSPFLGSGTELVINCQVKVLWTLRLCSRLASTLCDVYLLITFFRLAMLFTHRLRFWLR